MAYISKEEKKIPIEDPSGKWSDLTLLPEWEEKYYNVYTVRKHGKWVMLKALKPEYADQEKYRNMLDHEFETRYGLAHPNIVMVTDYEDIPGVGRAIITGDVYGYSLRRLIDEKRLTPRIIHRLETQLLDAMSYIQENHLVHKPLTADRIIFTEYDENLQLIDVGYDQLEELTPQDTASDIDSYGQIIQEVLPHLPEKMPRLEKIAKRCRDNGKRYRTVQDLRMALEQRSMRSVYIFVAVFIALMAALVIWLTQN